MSIHKCSCLLRTPCKHRAGVSV
ncbi:MAG: SWIM zinc finger family protein [Bacteroidales bacterium]|nr:SWIM zinc finger family protein [Bacteroidales bacterium]